jgi:rhamnosyltransferase subunit B
MRFVISALGSAGDVHPFIAIGEALGARGHTVRILAAPPFEERIRRAGLDFAAMGTADEYERLLQRPELWDPRRGARLIVDELLNRLPEAYAATDACAEEGDVLVGSTLSWAMRLVQERRRLPGATVHLSPMCLQSATQPAALPGVGDLSWMPAWALRALQATVERFVIDRWIGPRLNGLRAQLGLAPVRRIWSRWIHSPDLVIGAWPPWFAPPQADWPPNVITPGFPLFAEGGAALPAELTAFLDAGAPPVGITPGSAMAHGERFFARALAACVALGRRAVVITPYRAQLPAVLPSSVHAVAYAPFSALLPRLSALIHHGGIGTSAQALSAGIAQVVVPFAHDQFDNAARLARLGVSRTLGLSDDDSTWTKALRDAVETDAVRQARDRMTDSATTASLSAERMALALERLGARS